MRHFGKIANRSIGAFAGKIFGENPGKNFWQNCFGRNPVKSIIAELKICANQILPEGRKPTADVRELGVLAIRVWGI